MLYGAKCSKCGLTQLPKPTCKACGAALDAPSEAPRRTSSRAPLITAPKALSKPPLRTYSNTPPDGFAGASSDMTLDIPFEDSRKVPSNGPSEGRTSRTAKNCSECGMVYFDDELIQFGDALVCGQCKPLFVQKLKEGVTVAGEMVYAGFWIRVGAKIIDVIILYALGFAVSLLGFFITGIPSSGSQIPMRFMAGNILIAMISWVIQIAYPVYFLGKYGATLGKMACGLKVVRPNGEKISYARACGRAFAEGVSSLTLGIGYIMVALDEEKRSLHDRICDTRVIRA
jgi:uncharacterized RDD family membrane protein YckC